MLTLRQEQRDLLQPRTGSASSADFDITLMMVFFRHLTPLRIGNKLPVEVDTSTAADLTRITYFRNKRAHSDSIDDQEFEEAYSIISKAIIRLGGTRFKDQCEELRHKRLDANLPPAVKDIQEYVKAEWSKTDTRVVVLTNAIKWLIDKTKCNNVVTVTGVSGSGKSTAVHHVALYLERELKYQIFAVHSPKDLMTYYVKGKKLLFVFDDVCGKYSLDIHKLMIWKDLSNEIKLCFKDGFLKCLFTCRTHIFNEAQFQNVDILSSINHDMLSPQFNLSNEERTLIAKSYLTPEEVNTVKDLVEFNAYDCLPLLCQFYSTKRFSDITIFFKNPTQVIEDELTSFKNTPDQTTFAVLALFVIFNNKVDKLAIELPSFRDILQEIADNVTTSSTLSSKVVKDQLKGLSNTYVRIQTEAYNIIHDKWFDTIVSFYGRHMFDVILRLSHPDIIRDRFHFEIIRRYQEKHSQVISVPIEKESDYMERLCKDIMNGYVEQVFTNKQLQFLTFRLKFIEHLRRKSIVVEMLQILRDTSPLNVVSQQNYLDIMKALLKNNLDVNVMNKFGTTPLFIASENGHVGMIKLLLAYDCDPNTRRLETSKTPLFIAVEKGHTQVVKLLLKHKADPNVRTEDKKTPLYIAANLGLTDIVELLLENKCDITFCGNQKSPLFIAARLGHTDIVRLLLESSSDPNMISEDFMHCEQSPLCIASKYGHNEIVELLLEHKADSNSRTKDGLHPLYIASREGFTNIVKLLIDYKADVNGVVHFKINRRHAVMFSETETIIKSDSSLCVASEMGFSDIVLLLLQNESNPNLCRLDSMDISLSPLCISATYGWMTIIKLLLTYKANPNLQMEHQDVEPPLFKASENGNVQIVKILLKNNADPNLCSVSYECRDHSPLYKGCEKGHIQIVKILLENKADQNISGENRKSPLRIAKEKRYQEIVLLLQQFGK
ncbi:uncharacterized protein LOC127710935 [Mytilus californianus]|uniref:uncharacterized protein LOC127710935 n=1 Tax=Mytilus californianus TaxID=6549 RepID=UPI00224585D0|nr:uncharacterized protein LOC127710935 [Mytilus californianus]